MVRVPGPILAAVLALALTGCGPDKEEVESFPPLHPPLLVAQQGVREGEVVLRWSSAGSGVTRWQYRQRDGWDWEWIGSVPSAELPYWTPWVDVPGSDADTTGYRVSGLDDHFHFFQVRPYTADGPGHAYGRAMSRPPTMAPDGIPYVWANWVGVLPETGHLYRYSGTDLVFEVPAGLLLLFDEDGDTVTLRDALSPAHVVLDRETGEVVRRYNDGWPFSSRDMEELFDRLIASIRRVPLDATAVP